MCRLLRLSDSTIIYLKLLIYASVFFIRIMKIAVFSQKLFLSVQDSQRVEDSQRVHGGAVKGDYCTEYCRMVLLVLRVTFSK